MHGRTRWLLLLTISACLAAVGCSGCCSGDSTQEAQIRPLPQSDPLVMIIKHRSDTASTTTAGQLTQSFDYTKIPYTTYDLHYSQGKLTIPNSVRLICLTTSNVEEMPDSAVEKLVEFVAAGNSLLTTTPILDQRFGYLLGIKPQSDYQQQLKAQGFQFNQQAFPGFKEGSFLLSKPFYHRGFAKSVFTDSAEIIATSKDSLQTPVIVENEIGQGSSLLFNSQIGSEKTYRGILFSMATKMLEGVAWPVANASTIFLDDFPAPLYNEKMPPIDWEYNITHAEFVTDVWWPDMQMLAERYNIDYSAMIAFNYNANVVPPFDFEEWTSSKVDVPGEQEHGSIGLAKDVAQSRHELAFHGYNHFSLWLEDWPNEEFMASALQAARKRWRIDDLGPLPVSYVPPTNLIDSTGLSALTKAMPQIKYMCSLYIGTPEDGTGREFGQDPYAPSLFDYPRITSGFVADDNSMFKQHSLYLLTGIWTHFVHPDDVFQVVQSREDIFASRNELGLGWHRNRELDYGLYEVFERRIQETVQNYPYIRFKAARDAAPIVKDWTKTQAYRSDTLNQRRIVYNYNSLQESADGENNPSYWFMYVTGQNRERLEQSLPGQTGQMTFTPYWDGYLAQFSTQRDTLHLPTMGALNNQPTGEDRSTVKRVLAEYRSYQADAEGAASSNWLDTRMEESLAQLRNNPGSPKLQNQVIDLAIEFSRLDLAISLLEKRLLTTEVWRADDIDKLVTSYGWAGKTGQAWSLLEKLWQRHHDQSVIALKNMMVAQYGVPDPQLRQQWLKRELELNPQNKEVLRQLVWTNQGPESWPESKKYLKTLLQLNPQSDTLYRYSLQRSLWYGRPDSTVQWLKSFPESTETQLQPLADQIAGLYAYSQNNYDQALVWAEKSGAIPTQTQLQWLQQAKREEEFRTRAVQEVKSHPKNDSLRAYVGTELIYGGNADQGYEVLYPLFKENKAPEEARKLIHSEIGYQSYEQKKNFYRQYPAFFTGEMTDELQDQYRMTEGTAGGLTGSYASDNFDNSLAEIGLLAEWGNRNQWFHTMTASRSLVRQDFNNRTLSDQITSLNYVYRRKYRNQSMQSTLGAGVTRSRGEVHPQLLAGLWKAGGDSTFTSGEISYSPVLTNSAINQDINRVRGTLYREDYWLRQGRLMTTFSGTANWYTDDVFHYEALGRFYFQLPFSTAVTRMRGIGEVAYLNATTNYSSGVPYWTPDRLFNKGAGLDVRYQGARQDPDFWVELEVMGKHNRDGFYLTSAARLYARIDRYWQLRLNAELSSSDLYRYNNVGFTLRYIFPKKLE